MICHNPYKKSNNKRPREAIRASPAVAVKEAVSSSLVSSNHSAAAAASSRNNPQHQQSTITIQPQQLSQQQKHVQHSSKQQQAQQYTHWSSHGSKTTACTNYSTNYNKFNSKINHSTTTTNACDESFDDGGVDWDAAVQLLDQVSNVSTASTTSASKTATSSLSSQTSSTSRQLPAQGTINHNHYNRTTTMTQSSRSSVDQNAPPTRTNAASAAAVTKHSSLFASTLQFPRSANAAANAPPSAMKNNYALYETSKTDIAAGAHLQQFDASSSSLPVSTTTFSASEHANTAANVANKYAPSDPSKTAVAAVASQQHQFDASSSASQQPLSIPNRSQPSSLPPRPSTIAAVSTSSSYQQQQHQQHTVGAARPVTTTGVVQPKNGYHPSPIAPRPPAWASTTTAVSQTQPQQKQQQIQQPSPIAPSPPTWESSSTATSSTTVLSQSQPQQKQQQQFQQQQLSSATPGGGSSSVLTSFTPSNEQQQIYDQHSNLPANLRFDPKSVLAPKSDGFLDTEKLIHNARLDETLRNGMILYPHQKDAIERSLQMRRFILALDMGLGKTLIGCVWAKAFQRCTTSTSEVATAETTKTKTKTIQMASLKAAVENSKKKTTSKTKETQAEAVVESSNKRITTTSRTRRTQAELLLENSQQKPASKTSKMKNKKKTLAQLRAALESSKMQIMTITTRRSTRTKNKTLAQLQAELSQQQQKRKRAKLETENSDTSSDDDDDDDDSSSSSSSSSSNASSSIEDEKVKEEDESDTTSDEEEEEFVGDVESSEDEDEPESIKEETCYYEDDTTNTIKIIVLCPVSLKAEWRRTAVEATDLKVQSDKDDSCDDTHHVFISSWAKIPTLAASGAGIVVTSNNSNKKDSKTERTTEIIKRKYVVIADEAHSMQSMQAARTRDALKLMSSRQCVGVLLLTGTPMKNGKPANLFPLLRAVNHPFGRNQRAYEAHFCNGHHKQFGYGNNKPAIWQANGASHLPELRKYVASHMMHLTKDAVLKDLPPQTRTFHHVQVSSRRQVQHNQAMQELARCYRKNFSNGSSGGGGGDAENRNEIILSAVQKLRMVSSQAKIEATVELAKTILAKEPAVVIFSSFVEVAKTVHQRLQEGGWDGELLTGETPPKKRQGMVDKFQNGLSPVFCCTFGAGGVGLTLTAASTVILLDRPWTPGDASQAEDRVRRIGQTKAVKSIWVSAFELDKQIDRILAQKSETTNAVLTENDGSNSKGASEDGPKLSVFEMLRTLLPDSNNNNNTSSRNNSAGNWSSSKGPAPGSSDATSSLSHLVQMSILQFSQDATPRE